MHSENFNFYFVHGLYCEEITEPLQQIRQFMDAHPNEFIIFDCQHFYNFSNGDYARLNKILLKIFEGKCYTSDDGALNKCTLEYANSLNRQLLVIYRYHQVPREFWGGGNWPTPWPNQIKVKKLEEYLDQNIQYRDPYTGYTRQCVLTPPVKFIVPRYNGQLFPFVPCIYLICFLFVFIGLFAHRFYSSLKAKCAANVNKKLIDWLKVQKPGPFELNGNQPTSNVFIADFVELNNFQFCRTVIELNDKIFKELICEQRSNDCMAAAAGIDDVGNDNEPQNLIKIHINVTTDNNCNVNSTLQS